MEKKLAERRVHEEKAYKVVTRLSADTIDESTLSKLARLIEPFHYEEIVEERFLAKLCGYSLCSNELKNIPSQKYQISATQNKVFDLSDRKRYCSVDCFRASKYVQEQISTTPVWLRHTPDYVEAEAKREIKFIPHVKAKKSTQDAKPKTEDNATSSRTAEAERKAFAVEIESELEKVEEQWRAKFKLEPKKLDAAPSVQPAPTQPEKPIANNIYKKLNVNEKKFNVTAINDPEYEAKRARLKAEMAENLSKLYRKPTELNSLTKVFDDQSSVAVQAKLADEKLVKNYLFIEYLIQRLADLVTKKTKAYLAEAGSEVQDSLPSALGAMSLQEEREREEQIEKCDRYVTNTGILFGNLTNSYRMDEPNHQMASNGESASGFYRPPVAALDGAEIDEEEMRRKIEYLENIYMNDKETKGQRKGERKAVEPADSEDSTARKPVPNFNQLQEEAKLQQLRVKEFFTAGRKPKKTDEAIEEGDEEEEEEGADPNAYKQDLLIKVKGTDEEICRILPTVDSKSQLVIRRKIFYEKLVKYMEQILKFSDFSYAKASVQLKNHVKNFVYSLKLSNENIIFGTNEWPIISMFILKILSLKANNTTLAELIDNDRLVDKILESFALDRSMFEAICKYLITS